jgi:cob(I)alamin adenosyltransferase
MAVAAARRCGLNPLALIYLNRLSDHLFVSPASREGRGRRHPLAARRDALLNLQVILALRLLL